MPLPRMFQTFSVHSKVLSYYSQLSIFFLLIHVITYLSSMAFLINKLFNYLITKHFFVYQFSGIFLGSSWLLINKPFI